jgi:hypothetical protein
LLGQRIHQVQIEVIEFRRAQLLHRAMRIVGGMNASQHLQSSRVKTLRAQGHPIDAGLRVARESAALDGARVRLQRNFHIVREGNPLPERRQQAREFLWAEQARRAAAEKYAVNPAARHPRRLDVEVADQGVDVRRIRLRRLQLMRIEVTIRAFAHAPRHMHVQRQRGVHHLRTAGCA